MGFQTGHAERGADRTDHADQDAIQPLILGINFVNWKAHLRVRFPVLTARISPPMPCRERPGLKRRQLWIILASMFIPPPGRWMGFCVAACVLALFFFPLAHGSFQATHGPTTAFRARRVICGIIHAMVRAILLALACVLTACRVDLDRLALRRHGPGSLTGAVPSTPILRC
jgi:hypothetical protein